MRLSPAAPARRRRDPLGAWARGIGAFAVGTFLVTAFTPVPNWLADLTRVAADLGRADAIVVLGAGGPMPEGMLGGPSVRKALYGIRLFRLGLAPLLVLSGAPDRDGQRGEVSLRIELARESGVPEGAIVAQVDAAPGIEPTTGGEAGLIRRLLAGRNVRSILLVTDSQHMRRARRVFAAVGFQTRPAPVDELAPDTSAPEDRLQMARWLVEEAAADLLYRLRGPRR
jgi:uncharacterized SAM-binding protein YcdF (DUF218 family)